MINLHFIRDNGGTWEDKRELTAGAALEKLVKFELGYGGQVVSADANTITVQTRVFNCLDTSRFSGSAEEMRPLVEMVYWFQKTAGHKDTLVDAVIEKLEDTPGKKGMRRFYLRNVAPLMLGTSRVMTACLLALGVEDQADIARAARMRIEDLLSLLHLMQEPGAGTFPSLADELAL